MMFLGDITYDVSCVPLDWVGSKGLFLGMIVALVAVTIFAKILKKGWVIKLPAGVPPTVAKSFEALIPAAIVMTVFFLINWVFTLTSYGNLHNFIFKILQVPLLKLGNTLPAMVIAYLFLHGFWFFGINGSSVVGAVFNPILKALSVENLDALGNTLPAMVIAYLFLHGFWFFGINGSSVVGAVFNPILKALSVENLDAFKAGQEIPNIITGQFQDMFATFGGAGSTLSLIIAIFIVCRSQRIKQMGKLSFLPGVFGINEPIIFGLPIMLNPLMLIPFALIPTINIIITYFCMTAGLVPLTNGVQIPWTTPPVISGFLVSGWQGSVLQLILIILGVVLYIPFIKMLDKQYLKEEAVNAANDEDDDIDFDDLTL